MKNDTQFNKNVANIVVKGIILLAEREGREGYDDDVTFLGTTPRTSKI